uniref:MOB family member 4, phocein n=1 Tax=Cyprinus carpio carpio TaxID=630221 RepID=A0A9J8B3V3_CYPCA
MVVLQIPGQSYQFKYSNTMILIHVNCVFICCPLCLSSSCSSSTRPSGARCQSNSKSVEMVMAEGTAVLRRNRPGTKAKDFYNWSDESFEEMDSTLAVQQVRAFLTSVNHRRRFSRGAVSRQWPWAVKLQKVTEKSTKRCQYDFCCCQ